MRNQVVPLFPYPVMIAAQRYEFSGTERAFIEGLKMSANVGNSMSSSDRVLDSEELAPLRRWIDKQIDIYKKNVFQMKDDNEIYITQSWVNRSGPNEFHPRHKHQNSVFSGVMFLDPNPDDDLPHIRFHRTLEMFPLEFNFEALNEHNSGCRTFAPAQGMLILFPSLLEHDVGQNTTGRARSSLSFNTYVRGVVGGKNQLTEVRIERPDE